MWKGTEWISPLNAKLNTICHFLALLGAHHILHVSRIGLNFVEDEVQLWVIVKAVMNFGVGKGPKISMSTRTNFFLFK